MNQYHVQFAEKAWAKVEAHATYITREHHAPINAARWVNRLIKTADGLAFMPRRHTLDERQTGEVGESVYRMVFERTYLVFYVIHDDDQTVSIIDFEHASRVP